MQSKQDRMAQILLYIVLCFLTVFFIFGLYALISRYVFHSPNNLILAGWLSIGVSLIGFGLVLFLQATMMSGPSGSFFSTFRLNAAMPVVKNSSLDKMKSTAKTKFKANVSSGNIVVDKTMVYLCDSSLCIECFPKLDTEFLFSDITGYTREKNIMTLYGSFECGNHQSLDSIRIEAEMALSLRIIETELTNCQIKKQ